MMIAVALGLSACVAVTPQAGGGNEVVTTVILVRHAEKASGADPALTEAGEARAEALVAALRGALPAGGRLDVALATDTKRAQATAAPAARAYGIEITTTPIAGGMDAYFEDVVRRVEGMARGGGVLVVGHSNTTPELVQLLTGATGLWMSEAEYGRLFVVRLFADGRREWEERAYGAR